MNARTLAALAALTMLAVGCDAGHDTDAPRSAPDTTAPSEVAATRAPVTVPDLNGVRVADARVTLRYLGLGARVLPGAMSACVPAQTVVRQEPPVGSEVAPGDRVRLIVNVDTPGPCGLHLPPTSADLSRIADRFVTFARDTSGRDGPPADTPVELFIGGELAKVVPSTRLTDRHAWATCPRSGLYAARGCPISVLVPFVNYSGPIAATRATPEHPCLRTVAELPARLDAYRSVTLTPDEPRACTSYFAAQLFVNDVGQIVAVNLALSEP